MFWKSGSDSSTQVFMKDPASAGFFIATAPPAETGVSGFTAVQVKVSPANGRLAVPAQRKTNVCRNQ